MNKLTKRRYWWLLAKQNATGINRNQLARLQQVFAEASFVEFLQWLKQLGYLEMKNQKLYLTKAGCQQVKKLWPGRHVDQFGTVKAVAVRTTFDFPVKLRSTVQNNGRVKVTVSYLFDRLRSLTESFTERLVVDDWREAKDVTTLTGAHGRSLVQLVPKADHQSDFRVSDIFA